MTDPDYYERLAAAYLKALARADMAAYRRFHSIGESAADPFDHETLKEAARMKRVRLAGYQRPLEQK
jgi:hypothetical protein